MKAFTKNIIKVALLAALISVPFMAQAGSYPERPVTIIVPFGAGGSTDTMARAAARELEDILGTNVPVKNIGGGAGTIGAAQIARSRPDGYTIGVIPAAPLINQPHMRKTPYTINDFTYICQLFHSPQALALSPNSKFKSLKEIVDYAREHPGKLTYGSPGPASLPHLAMEKFLLEAKVDITHVPFKGDAAGVTALMGNHIDLYMAIMSNVLKKDLNAVVVFADERVKAAPNISTSIENGFKTTASWWEVSLPLKTFRLRSKLNLKMRVGKRLKAHAFKKRSINLVRLLNLKTVKLYAKL